MTTDSLRRAGLTVIGVTLAVRALGFLREAVVAAVFGTSASMDVYLAAITIPSIIITVLYHSIPNAFTSVLTSGQSAGPRARKYTRGLIVALALVSLLVFAGAPYLASLTNGGFSAPLRAESVVLLRIASAAILFAALEAIGRTRRLVRKSFAWASASYLWQSLAMIAAVVGWPGSGTRALMWGLVCGTGLAALWNLWPTAATRRAVVGEPAAAESSAAPQAIWRWIAIVILVDASAQLYALVDRHFASMLPEGSIASLQYANLVAFMPSSLFGLSLSTVIYPYIAESVHAGQRERVADLVNRSIRLSILVTIPLTVLFIMYREQIVSLLLERGAFTAASRVQTATLLAIYSCSLLPAVTMAVAARVFHSSRRWKPLAAGAVAGVGVKCLGSIALAAPMGAEGLALATVLGLTASGFVLLAALPDWCTRPCRLSWVRHAAISAATFIIASVVSQAALSRDWTGSILRTVAGPMMALTLGGVMLWIAGGPLGLTEVEMLKRSIVKRARRFL